RSGAAKLWFRFRLPQRLISEIGPITLRARIQHVELPPLKCSVAGDYVYIEPVPIQLNSERVEVVFETDKAYGPTPSDPRELGVQVVARSRCGITPREMSVIHFIGNAPTP